MISGPCPFSNLSGRIMKSSMTKDTKRTVMLPKKNMYETEGKRKQEELRKGRTNNFR